MYSRATGSVLSQMATSATNFLVTLVVARGGDLAELGTFSLVFLFIAILIQFLRSSIGQALLLDSTQEAGPYLRAQTGVGFAGSVLAAVTATLLFGDVWAGVITFFAALLGFIQDGLRYVQAQAGAWMKAATSDLSMLVVVMVGATIAIAHGISAALFMMASWGCGALAGVLVLVPWIPRCRGVSGTSWMRGAKGTLMPLALEGGVILFSLYLSNWLIAGLASVSVLGIYRATQVSMNPIGSLGGAMTMLMLSPNGVGGQRLHSGPGGAYGVFAGYAGALSLALGLWTGLLYLGVGALLFGQTWGDVAPVCALVASGQALAMVSLVGAAIIKRLVGPAWTLRLWLSVCWAEPLMIGIATVAIPVIGPMVGWVGSQVIVGAATMPTMKRAIARRFTQAVR